MKIIQLTENKKQHLDLLLADEQESMIDRYLEHGELFVLDDNGVKAICVITNEGDGVCELKNIAVAPESQRQGYDKKLIEYLIAHYAGKFSPNDSRNRRCAKCSWFLRKLWFEYSHRIENFFIDNYDHQMFEDGGVAERYGNI